MKEQSIEDWRKKIKKLKRSYKNYDGLREHCIKIFGLQYFSLSDVTGEIIKSCVSVMPEEVVEPNLAQDRVHSCKDVPTFMYQDDKSLKRLEVATIINKLAEKLKDYINPKDLIKDVLNDQSVESVLDLEERIFQKEDKTKPKKKVKIIPEDDCFRLKIGGKPGAPALLYIRE